MAKIVIKKKVDLEDILGEDYKGSYLTFRSISMEEFESMSEEIENVQEDNAKATKFILAQLESRFVEGKFDGQELAPENIKELDVASVIKCFEALTTRAVDPKV